MDREQGRFDVLCWGVEGGAHSGIIGESLRKG